MKKNQWIKPDSIIFDLDGTLWDGVETYAKGFNDYFNENNIDRHISKMDLTSYMGLEEAQFLNKVFPDYHQEEQVNKYQQIKNFQYKRIASDGGELYPCVKEGLSYLSEKFKLFIASNCPENTISYFMKWAGIEEYITDSIAHGMNHKPKYENIQFLIKKYHLINPVYVGDTDSDRIQCDLVPLPFIFVSYGFGSSQTFEKRFNSFRELSEFFLSEKLQF